MPTEAMAGGTAARDTAVSNTAVRDTAARNAVARETRRANDAWEALMSAYATLMKQFAADDIWGELTMREYDVLYTLSKCPRPVKLAELNRFVLLSQPALSRMVDRLVERGLVQRAPDPSDRRGLALSLTSTGAATQREVGRRHARSVARAVAAPLSANELEQLETICWKLARRPPDTGLATNDRDTDTN
ncbi:MAG TPA: MarR family transcriptional regulator [Pseudonocardiaceae bacterium]